MKRKHKKESKIVVAIHEPHSSCIQVELSNHKLDLIQQQEACLAKEEQLMFKEEVQKEKRRRVQGQRAPLQ